MNPFYTDYSEYLSQIFPGKKVQKISVDAGRSCPNRDGTIGRDGCLYCDNRSFTPSYCSPGNSISRQIELGKDFFRRKYPTMCYLVYFQAFTFTYGVSAAETERIVGEALSQKDVVGAVIGTRPDCFSPEIADILAGFNRTAPVMMEFGAETSFDRTLERINRGHTWGQTVEAVELASSRGLRCGLHLIAGLPGETLEDTLVTVEKACRLPVDSLKLHQLQLIKGTPLWRQWHEGVSDISVLSLGEYLDFCCRVVEVVPRRIAIERFLSQAPPAMVEVPSWGLKNHEFTNLLISKLSGRAKSFSPLSIVE